MYIYIIRTLHPIFSNNILIENITINTDGPNTDGIDPDSCSNVIARNSYITTGDDCIAIKSGKNEDGRAVGIPTDNVLMENLILGYGHGISIGSEMSGNVTNVIFRNLTMHNTENGPRIKSCRGRGGMVKNITYENISINDVSEGIQITQYYDNIQTGIPPIFKDFYISNLTGTVKSGGKAGEFDCLPESPCHDFILMNIDIKNYKESFECEYAYGNATNVEPKSCLMKE